MFAAITTTTDAVEAVGRDEKEIIESLGEAHKCFYQQTPWTADDVERLESGGWVEIKTDAVDHNKYIDVEVFEVPDSLQRRVDIREHFDDLRELPPPVKTIRLFLALPRLD